MYFSISLGLGHKGFHRKLHLTTLLFNLYLGSILRNTYLPLKLCMSLGNLYIYMYIETERCTVLHFDINVVRYFLFTCSGKTSDYNIKFWYVFLVICSEFCQYRMIFHKNVRLTSVCISNRDSRQSSQGSLEACQVCICWFYLLSNVQPYCVVCQN